MKQLELDIDFTEEIQYLQQEFFDVEIGEYFVNFIFSADITIDYSTPVSFYEERQNTVKILNPEIEIQETFKGEEMVELTPAQEKELKKEILNSIL